MVLLEGILFVVNMLTRPMAPCWRDAGVETLDLLVRCVVLARTRGKDCNGLRWVRLSLLISSSRFSGFVASLCRPGGAWVVRMAGRGCSVAGLGHTGMRLYPAVFVAGVGALAVVADV